MPQGSENLDPDILQCKKDILKASGAVQPLSNTRGQHKPSPALTEKNNILIREFESLRSPAQSKEVSKPLVNSAPVEEPKDEIEIVPLLEDTEGFSIPRFDLADEIMANHRKVVSISRKKPGYAASAAENMQTKPVSQQSCSSVLRFRPQSTFDVVCKIVSSDIHKLSMPKEN